MCVWIIVLEVPFKVFNAIFSALLFCSWGSWESKRRDFNNNFRSYPCSKNYKQTNEQKTIELYIKQKNKWQSTQRSLDEANKGGCILCVFLDIFRKYLCIAKIHALHYTSCIARDTVCIHKLFAFAYFVRNVCYSIFIGCEHILHIIWIYLSKRGRIHAKNEKKNGRTSV